MRFVFVQFMLVVDSLFANRTNSFWRLPYRWLERNDFLSKQDARLKKRERLWCGECSFASQKDCERSVHSGWRPAECVSYVINGIWLTLKASVRRVYFKSDPIRQSASAQRHKCCTNSCMPFAMKYEIWNESFRRGFNGEEHFHWGTIAIKMFPNSDWRDMKIICVFPLCVVDVRGLRWMKVHGTESNLSGPSSFKFIYLRLNHKHTRAPINWTIHTGWCLRINCTKMENKFLSSAHEAWAMDLFKCK